MGSLLDQIKSTARPTKSVQAKGGSKRKRKKPSLSAKKTYSKSVKSGKSLKPRTATRRKGSPTLKKS